MFKHCHGPDNVLNLPLTTLKKEYDSDDEIDDSCCIRPKRRHSLDDMTRRIKFNEELVICYYRPREPPTALQKEVDKCFNDKTLTWVNPKLKKERKKSVF